MPRATWIEHPRKTACFAGRFDEATGLRWKLLQQIREARATEQVLFSYGTKEEEMQAKRNSDLGLEPKKPLPGRNLQFYSLAYLVGAKEHRKKVVSPSSHRYTNSSSSPIASRSRIPNVNISPL